MQTVLRRLAPTTTQSRQLPKAFVVCVYEWPFSHGSSWLFAHFLYRIDTWQCCESSLGVAKSLLNRTSFTRFSVGKPCGSLVLAKLQFWNLACSCLTRQTMRIYYFTNCIMSYRSYIDFPWQIICIYVVMRATIMKFGMCIHRYLTSYVCVHCILYFVFW